MNPNCPEVLLLVRAGLNVNELQEFYGLTPGWAEHVYSVAFQTVREQDIRRISGYTDAKRARDREHSRNRKARLAGSQSGVR